MNFPQLLLISFVEENKWMEIAIASMEDIGDGKVIFLPTSITFIRTSGSFVRGTVPSQTR